jgi:ankyrin repeat protein
VKQFVSAGHNNLPEVKRMLAEEPGLLYASWDLGGGDFESALGGAGHVGDKEIAMYLIGQGARASIFVHAMLGRTALVKRMIEFDPAVLNSKGPHGFTLLHHAERGGEEASELLAYIQGLGLSEKKFSMP